MRYDPFEKTTKIPFKVVDGKLVHFDDKKPITELQDGSSGNLTVKNFSVKDAARLQQYNAECVTNFLPQGSHLKARISVDKTPKHLNEAFTLGDKLIDGGAVEIILTEDLQIRLRGTKAAQLLPCKCAIPALASIIRDDLPTSLNQAYSLISTHFEPLRRSHSGNVFDLVYYYQEPTEIWQRLRYLRDQVQANHENLVTEKPTIEQVEELSLAPPKSAGLADAIAVASKAHINQIDKVGAPYILHPLRMMLRLDGEDERIVAVLHDVVEDTKLTLADLRNLGFSETVICAVEALTQGAGESYEHFVDRARNHPIARQVKLVDIEDNLDLLRLTEITEEDVERLRRYHQAHRLLLS